MGDTQNKRPVAEINAQDRTLSFHALLLPLSTLKLQLDLLLHLINLELSNKGNGNNNGKHVQKASRIRAGDFDGICWWLSQWVRF